MDKRNSFSIKLSPEQQLTLVGILRQGNYRPVPVEYTLAAVETDDVRICVYRKGTCLVQGKGAEDFVQFILEPMVLGQVAVGYEDVLNPEATQPHMGIDESGKGDFFGPLVIAAAYVDPTLADAMRKLDVKDSKRITSDDKARHVGRELRKLLGRRFALIRIGPESYNRLYAKMRSVNAMLSWAHARAIENLLEAIPDCPRAISDQFGDARQVERALMKKGRQIELVQRHRAESDLAVAAASILAREAFLNALSEMRTTHPGHAFPKGASSGVREAAVSLVRAKTPAILLQTAKCHFKTADEVLAAAGSSRASLGPEGQAMSRPVNRERFRKGPPKTPATD